MKRCVSITCDFDLEMGKVKGNRSYSFWIYRIPAEIGLTQEGMYGVMMHTQVALLSEDLTMEQINHRWWSCCRAP